MAANIWSAVCATQWASAMRGGFCGEGKCRRDHRGDGPAATEDRCGFVHPGAALLGERSRFVLGVAGFQGCLLSQV
jgi:uncharacterized low-complexity protein